MTVEELAQEFGQKIVALEKRIADLEVQARALGAVPVPVER